MVFPGEGGAGELRASEAPVSPLGHQGAGPGRATRLKVAGGRLRCCLLWGPNAGLRAERCHLPAVCPWTSLSASLRPVS